MATAASREKAGHEAMMHWRAALVERPADAETLRSFARGAQHLGDLEEASAAYRVLIAQTGDDANALVNLGIMLQEQGFAEEAVRCYERAYQVTSDPICRYAAALVTPPVYPDEKSLSYWRERVLMQLAALVREGVRFDPLRQWLPTGFHLAYQGLNDVEIQRMRAALVSGASADLRPAAGRSGRGSGCLRMGVFSPYLFSRNHTVSVVWGPLVACLDRQAVELTLITHGEPEDALGRWIAGRADRRVPLADLGSTASAIAAAGLDVLVYLDIGMNSASYALANLRLAPVQCVTWGHPVTTGLPTMDYFLSSGLLEVPEAQEHYSERLVRLSTMGLYYVRPRLPSPAAGREAFNLPAGARIYGCLQSLFKLHPDFDRIVEGVLRADPRGIVVLSAGRVRAWKDAVARRLASRMPDMMDRIVFQEWKDYGQFMRLMQLMDVNLVPTHFGGGRTTYEAVALGVPSVTLPSRFLKGRISHGLLSAMSLDECIAADEEDYVARAVRLASEPAEAAALQKRMDERSRAVFEQQRALEEFTSTLQALASDASEPGG